MNFNILRSISATVQSRPGIRIPQPHQALIPRVVSTPVRLRPVTKSLPVILPRVPYGTEEVTTIIQDQRANPGLSDFLSAIFKRVRK